MSNPRIWCNAASTGEEPHSIAMTVLETLGASTGARILASDIDTRCWATAARGVYPADSRGLSPERLRRHCLRGTGANAGFMRIRPELSKLIEFRTHNLMAAHWSLGEPFDFVFCRNVMICFDAATQRRVLERIHAVMKPGGLLCSSATPRTSPIRASCSACAARPSTSASDTMALASPLNPRPARASHALSPAQARKPGEASFFFYDAHFKTTP